MAELSDEELMGLYQAGDSEAFAALFVRHSRLLYCALYCLLTDEKQAMEVASQTWLDVHRRRGSYRRPQSFRCFLFGLAAQNRRAVERDLAISASQPGEPRPVTDPASLAAALRRLPDSYREVVVLQRWLGLSVAEVAAVLGATADAVGKRAGAGEEQLAQAGVELPSPALGPAFWPVLPTTLDHIARAVLPAVERARPPMTSALLLSGLLLCLGLVLSLSLFWVHLRR
ncbi:MAG TPA: sigma factor-like helix-turn-helix DNA-binding protein [Pseudomonadota bacterium]|nr:sigma factor-like helix-turn-helix DNA-binding protein [Pseudomonadota bacterium]